MDPDLETVERRWSVKKRLEFLESQLFWDGRFNRNSLIDHFGVSAPQATQDIKRYGKLAPNCMFYETKKWAFVPTNSFVPRFFRPSAARFLAQLRALKDEVIGRSDVPVMDLPSYDIVPTLRRDLDTSTVQKIVLAINGLHSVEIEYQSLSSPTPKRRRISPHSLGFDGRRWHARAWCHERSRFADFALARIFSVDDEQPTSSRAEEDEDWQTIIVLTLAPNPGLSAGMKRAIEIDYNMRSGKVDVPIRRALAFYMCKQLQLDRAVEGSDPRELQIYLKNRDKVLPMIGLAEGEEAR